MVGSSASNEYGSGGTVNATGFSSKVRFESELVAVSARKKPGAEFPAPSNPAPTIPVFNKKLRRFMGSSAARRANRPARGIIPPVPARWESGSGKPRYPRYPGLLKPSSAEQTAELHSHSNFPSRPLPPTKPPTQQPHYTTLSQRE